MLIETCNARAELEAARELRGRPDETKWAQIAIRYYAGVLKAGENRAPARPRTKYAAGIAEPGDGAFDAGTIQILKEAAYQAIMADCANGGIEVHLSPGTTGWAVSHGLTLPKTSHELINPAWREIPMMPGDEPELMLARSPVSVPESPSGIAMARALMLETRWTPTLDRGAWPSAEVGGIEWTNTDGQMGTIGATNMAGEDREIPARVESLRLNVWLAGANTTIRTTLFTDDRMRLSSTDAVRGQYESVSSTLSAMRRTPGAQDKLDEDSCAAIALAHTAERAEAYQAYTARIRKKYLDNQMEIIDREGWGRSPTSVVMEYATGRRALEEAAEAVREALHDIREQTDEDGTVDELEAAVANLLSTADRTR